MDTPRDIAKRHRPGRPMEDELEDDIARHVIAKDKRLMELEDLLERGLRFAETCSWDKLEPPGFRARAEVWIADASFALTQRTKS